MVCNLQEVISCLLLIYYNLTLNDIYLVMKGMECFKLNLAKPPILIYGIQSSRNRSQMAKILGG